MPARYRVRCHPSTPRRAGAPPKGRADPVRPPGATEAAALLAILRDVIPPRDDHALRAACDAHGLGHEGRSVDPCGPLRAASAPARPQPLWHDLAFDLFGAARASLEGGRAGFSAPQSAFIAWLHLEDAARHDPLDFHACATILPLLFLRRSAERHADHGAAVAAFAPYLREWSGRWPSDALNAECAVDTARLAIILTHATLGVHAELSSRAASDLDARIARGADRFRAVVHASDRRWFVELVSALPEPSREAVERFVR